MPGTATFKLELELGDDSVPASPQQVAASLEALAAELRDREEWGRAVGRLSGCLGGTWGVYINVVIS